MREVQEPERFHPVGGDITRGGLLLNEVGRAELEAHF